jgi:uncharacterized iron-regulated membrane protein
MTFLDLTARSPLRLHVRSLLVAAHRFVGLAIAGFLIVAGLTGAVISWDHELDEWLNPHLYQAPGRGALLSPFALVDRAEAADPKAWVTYFPLSVTEGKALVVFAEPRPDPQSGKLHEISYNQVFLDPVSGEILGRREWGAIQFDREHFVPFLYAFHFSLCLPEFRGIESWGMWLMGAIALLWVFDCFVGFLVTLPRTKEGEGLARSTYWSRWKPAWRIKWQGSPYRINFDIHRAFGLWLWLLLFILAVSAVSLNLEREVVRPILGLFTTLTPSPADERVPNPADKPIVPRLSTVEIAKRAEAERQRRGISEPIGAIGYLQQVGIYRVDFFSRGGAHGTGGGGPPMLYIDGTNGQILGFRQPWQGTAGDLFLQLQFPLHSGRIAGFFGRILVSCMGLLVAALAVTGIVIWWKKRRARVWSQQASEGTLLRRKSAH